VSRVCHLYRLIRAAALDHDRAKAELKALCRDELVETEIGRAAL
jgi:hypothetical protein